MLKKLSLLIVGIAVATQLASALTFNVDPNHSQIGFSVKHMVLFTVKGYFKEFKGVVIANPADRSIQSIKGTIQSQSVDTRISQRDDDLKSFRFFDVENFPTITFVSTNISGKGDNITVVGDLTIRGVTKSVTLKGAYLGNIKDPWKNDRSGFKGTTTINRKDFGLRYNDLLEAGGAIVSDEVTIELEVQAISKPI